MNEEMRRIKHMAAALVFLMAGLAALVCSCGSDEPETNQPTKESLILTGIKKKADLVTTEVKVRKLAIYDSSTQEQVRLADPRTWKYGERKCIVPVEVTIKYGYDLRDVTVDNIKLTDDSTAVIFLLPKPKIIDSGYEAKVDEKAIVRMSSGLRDAITNEEMDALMEKAYKSVMKQDFTDLVGRDVENNAKVLFSSVLRSIGMENAAVVIQRKEDWVDEK